MTLEKEDWEEPDCCLRPHKAGFWENGGSGREKTLQVREVIRGFDRLLERDAKEEAGLYLEDWLARFRDAGDWGAQITILNEMMGFYRHAGDREKGLAAAEEGLRLAREHRLFPTVTGGTTCVNAATTMKAFGRAEAAIPLYDQAFRSYGGNLDPGDYRFGGLFNNMALAWEDLGEYEKAETYYWKAMEIMEALRPGSALEIAVTWMNLAVLYEKAGREEEIDGCLEKALEIFRSREVSRDGYYAFNCRKCAETFGHFGYFRIKKELAEAAERIYQAAGKEPER